MMTEMSGSQSRMEEVKVLEASRDKSWFLRGSAVFTLFAVGFAWFTSRPLLGRLSAERRWSNFQNFAEGLVPSPVRKSGDWGDAFPWAWELLTDGGFIALLSTVGIAAAAILLAGAFVLPILPLASRKFSRANPFGLRSGRSGKLSRLFWTVAGPVVRFSMVLSRSVPEYLIAFLLLSLLGLQVWPLVLALAIHNFGILGRLWGEVVENADEAAAMHHLGSGSGRVNVFATATLPGVLNRFLIYFFYRWETCVKDATVLGMLGLLTIGKLIALAKGFFWDEMFFYILLSASVIILMDFISTWLRRRLR